MFLALVIFHGINNLTYCGCFQANNVMSLNIGLGRDGHNLLSKLIQTGSSSQFTKSLTILNFYIIFQAINDLIMVAASLLTKRALRKMLKGHMEKNKGG